MAEFNQQEQNHAKIYEAEKRIEECEKEIRAVLEKHNMQLCMLYDDGETFVLRYTYVDQKGRKVEFESEVSF